MADKIIEMPMNGSDAKDWYHHCGATLKKIKSKMVSPNPLPYPLEEIGLVCEADKQWSCVGNKGGCGMCIQLSKY